MDIKHLNYFVGRVCTIFTSPTNRNFKEENPEAYPEPIYHYFVGKILAIDEHGILMEQVLSPEKLKSYFFFHGIIGITEEQVLNPNNAQHAKEIHDIKAANEEMQNTLKKVESNPQDFIQKPFVPVETQTGQFMNLQNITKNSKEMQERFGK